MIVDSLLVICDPILEMDHINPILQGLEEYNSFSMMIYGKIEPFAMYDIETLLYVQEA